MKKKPDYTIQFEETEIHLLFNSYMYRSYCERKGIELEDLFESIRTGNGFKQKDLPDLLLVAAETFAAYNDLNTKYNLLQASEWVDALGGFNSVKLVDLYKVFVCKLINVDPAQFEVMWKQVAEPEVKDEKKSKKAKALRAA